jgi:hypothetical protein
MKQRLEQHAAVDADREEPRIDVGVREIDEHSPAGAHTRQSIDLCARRTDRLEQTQSRECGLSRRLQRDARADGCEEECAAFAAIDVFDLDDRANRDRGVRG